jgi:hypothetical protein
MVESFGFPVVHRRCLSTAMRLLAPAPSSENGPVFRRAPAPSVPPHAHDLGRAAQEGEVGGVAGQTMRASPPPHALATMSLMPAARRPSMTPIGVAAMLRSFRTPLGPASPAAPQATDDAPQREADRAGDEGRRRETGTRGPQAPPGAPVERSRAEPRWTQPATIQAKLEVGPPGDAAEHEADRVAEQVVGAPSGTVQRASAGETFEPKIQEKSLSGSAAPVPAGLAGRIHDLQGRGTRLPEPLRASLEPRFGRDFSDVRIHAGDRAASTARSLHARAFTLGRDIVFGAGQYAPSMADGRRLLAHELAHVVQQGHAAPLDGEVAARDGSGPAPSPIGGSVPSGSRLQRDEVVPQNVAPVNATDADVVIEDLGPIRQAWFDQIVAQGTVPVGAEERPLGDATKDLDNMAEYFLCSQLRDQTMTASPPATGAGQDAKAKPDEAKAPETPADKAADKASELKKLVGGLPEACLIPGAVRSTALFKVYRERAIEPLYAGIKPERLIALRGDKVNPTPKRKVTIDGVDVMVDPTDEAKARAILKDLSANYGIKLDSAAAKAHVWSVIQGNRGAQQSAAMEPEDDPTKKVDALNKIQATWKAKEADIQTVPWTYEELQTLQKVAHEFPDLQKRDNTLMDKDALKSEGRVKVGASKANTEPDPSLQGVYTGSQVVLTDSAYATNTKISDQRKRFEYVATHEMAHAALAPFVGEFVDKLPFWKDRMTRRDADEISQLKAKGTTVEEPCTTYAQTNANEDLAETAALYFVQPDQLKANCPLRYAFMQSVEPRLKKTQPAQPPGMSSGSSVPVPGPKP